MYEKTCYICDNKAEGWDEAGLHHMNCRRCGEYILTLLASRYRLDWEAEKALTKEERERLSIVVRAEYDEGKEPVHLTPSKIDKLICRPPKGIRVAIQKPSAPQVNADLRPQMRSLYDVRKFKP
jgi:hypothetical protein